MNMKKIAVGIAIAAMPFLATPAFAQNDSTAQGMKPSLSGKDSTAQQAPKKAEPMFMYSNLSLKGIFPMATWFGYTGNWQAVAFSSNGKANDALVQVNQQLPAGFCADITYDQPIEKSKSGKATFFASKKILGGKAAFGATLSTDKPISQSSIAAQYNPIHTDKALVAAGLQLSGLDSKVSAKSALEARKNIGDGRIIGFGGYSVLSEGKITEYGGSLGGALKNGKGFRLNIGAGMKGGNLQEIRAGAQLPTKKCGVFDARFGFAPKAKPQGNLTLYWILPQKR